MKYVYENIEANKVSRKVLYRVASSKVLKFKSLKNSKIQKFKNSTVQKFKSLKNSKSSKI